MLRLFTAITLLALSIGAVHAQTAFNRYYGYGEPGNGSPSWQDGGR